MPESQLWHKREVTWEQGPIRALVSITFQRNLISSISWASRAHQFWAISSHWLRLACSGWAAGFESTCVWSSKMQFILSWVYVLDVLDSLGVRSVREFGILFFVTVSAILWLRSDQPVITGGVKQRTWRKSPPNAKSLTTFSHAPCRVLARNFISGCPTWGFK